MVANELKEHMTLVEIISKENNFSRIESLFQNNIICRGIFIGFYKDEKWLIDFCKKHHKMVCIDIFSNKSDIGENTYLLNTKNYSANYKIVTELIKRKYTNILYFSRDKKRISLDEREKGYIDALKNNGISIREELIIPCSDSKEMSYIQVNQIIKSEIKFDAIFGANDLLCSGALKALKKHNMEKEISLFGFDNFESKILNFSSAMIDQSEAGFKAVDIITSNFPQDNCIELDVTYLALVVFKNKDKEF